MITTVTAGSSNSGQTDYEKYAFGPKPGQAIWAATSEAYKRGYRRWKLGRAVPKELIQEVLRFVAADDLPFKEKDLTCSVIERLIIEFASQPRLREAEALMTQLFHITGVSRYREEHQTQLRQDLGIYLQEVILRWVS